MIMSTIVQMERIFSDAVANIILYNILSPVMPGIFICIKAALAFLPKQVCQEGNYL